MRSVDDGEMNTESGDPVPSIDPRPAFRLPSHIMVSGTMYTVEVEEDVNKALARMEADDFHALGVTDTNLAIIRIRGGGEQTVPVARDTLLHETLHAIDCAVRLNLEEDDVHRLSGCLLDTLRRNPDLLAALISRDE